MRSPVAEQSVWSLQASPMLGVQPNASTQAMKDHSRIEPGGRMSGGNVADFFRKGTRIDPPARLPEETDGGRVSDESAKMPGGSRARFLGVAACLRAVVGCGGGGPLLHPAPVLPAVRA